MKKKTSIVKKIIEKKLIENANSTTCYNIYQPKVPNSLKRFKKR